MPLVGGKRTCAQGRDRLDYYRGDDRSAQVLDDARVVPFYSASSAM